LFQEVETGCIEMISLNFCGRCRSERGQKVGRLIGAK
jgi:hypothetical protein